MNRREKTLVWAAIVLLGGFLPFWWGLVYTGYYDDKMSPDKLDYVRSFIVSDSFLILLTAGLIRGIRTGWVWGYLCGLGVSVTGFYMTIHGLHAMADGTFPHDPATVWLYLSNFIGQPVVAWACISALRRRMTA